jgi:protocatechuate 3,4-dioxygenase beta subunit
MLNYLGCMIVLTACGLASYGVALSAEFSPVAAQAADRQQTFKIEGTVVNEATGRPIPRVLVEWYSAGGLISVLTGTEGEFVFNSVPQGRAQFSVQKPGYFTSHGGAMSPRPIVFNAGADSGKLTIKLIQEAVISGRVLGKDGEPLEFANVSIEKANANAAWSQRSFLQRNSVPTDEDGNFRIAELPPGQYLVSLRAGSVSRRILGNQSSGSQSGQRPEAYPAIVYYPAGSEDTNAEPINLLAGQHMEVNFSVAPLPAYRVAGTVSRVGDWKDVGAPVVVDHRGQPLLSVDEFDQQTGAFTFRTVPAGTYTLRLVATDQSDVQSTVQRRIVVNKDLTGMNLSLAAPLEVQVNVRKELASKIPVIGTCSYGSTDGKIHTSDCSDYPAIRIELQPTEASGIPVHSNWVPPATAPLILRGLQPGKYKVHAWPAMGQAYVSSLRCGFTDLLHEDLVVPESGQLSPIEAVLRDDMSMLQMSVNIARNTTGIIAILPDPFSPSDQVIRTNVTSDATAYASLAPGAYKIFAFADSEEIDLNDPEEIVRYEKKAASVNLMPGKTSSLMVELIRTGE